MLHQPTKENMDKSRLSAFAAFVSEHTGHDFGVAGSEAYQKLHQWSVKEPEMFHSLVWDFCSVVGDKGETAISEPQDILKASFFPGSKISFTENMLKRAATHPDEPAIISRTAGVEEDRIVSWRALYDEVSRWEQYLKRLGVGEGDRVATYMMHTPEAYMIMMAAANRGAIFSSVGSDMGSGSTIDRFKQIEPKILIAHDGYRQMTKPDSDPVVNDRTGIIADIEKAVPSIQDTVVLPNIHEGPDVLAGIEPREIEFERRDFNHPLAILFSSGSTGQPKCFVHGTGGTILKHAIEHQLQTDVRPGDVQFFHSTTSWMMFNWLASGLANDAKIMIYEGNPAYPDAAAQLQFASDYGCTHLGTAADIIHLWAKRGVTGEGLDLSKLRSIQYTASVLSEDGFRYVYDHIKKDVAVNGICGGTDFVGCYAMGNPWCPTIAGYLKGPVLGMNIDIYDDYAKHLDAECVGELVITSPFASRPLCFWGDDDGARFYESYFEFFEGKSERVIWRHGDAVKLSPIGQVFVEGRSDSTLNQGGVRIGSQQIYDALTYPDIVDLIEDSIAVNFKNAQGGDNTVLFIVPKDYQGEDQGLCQSVKAAVRDSVGDLCTPREILCVPYILKTPNGKRAEKPTKQLLAGEEVKTPETYGEVDGVLKTALFETIGSDLRSNPRYGFVDKPDAPTANQ